MSMFFAGLLYPLRAFALLFRMPRLWPFVLLPILINLVIGGTIYAGLLVAGLSQIDALMQGLPGWLAGIEWLLSGLLIVGLLLATGFVLVRFGVVLGSPFYGRLSELLETAQLGTAPPTAPFSIGSVLRDLGRALLFELKKLALALLFLVPTLLLNLIPVAGSVLAIIAQIAVGVTITCLDFFDSPLERRRLRFREKLAAIRRSLPASAGFGLVCLGLVSIPLINLLAVPLCVTAGTLFFCERIYQQAEYNISEIRSSKTPKAHEHAD